MDLVTHTRTVLRHAARGDRNHPPKVSLRRQIAATVGSGLVPPQAQLDLLNRFQNETRDVSFVKLDAAQAGTIETPSDEILKSYYEERKPLFRAPEYRKIVIITVTPEEVAKTVQISDEDARKGYELAKARIAVPEKRQIAQLMFSKPEEAEAARAKITAGAAFDDVAKELNMKPGDVDLGLITKSARSAIPPSRIPPSRSRWTRSASRSKASSVRPS